MMRTVAHRLVTAVGIAVVAFASIEALSRFWLQQFADNKLVSLFALPAEYEKRAAGNHQFSFQTGFGIYPNPNFTSGKNRHSGAGFRGEDVVQPKPSNLFRIIVLGSSTTYDISIGDWREAWPAKLGEILRQRGYEVDVVNAGVPAWTTREHLLSYTTRLSYLEPDLVVLYEGFNDLLFRAVWPPERLRSDYTSPEHLAPAFAMQPWYQSFTAIRVPLIMAGRMLPPSMIDPFWSDTVRSEGAANVLATIPAFTARLPALMNAMQSTLPPGVTLEETFRRSTPFFFQRNVETLARLARADNAKVLLVGFTLDWDWLARNAVDHGAGLKFGIAQMNRALAETATADGTISYYDLDASMPRSADDWSDFLHNSAKGAAAKAALVADFTLRERLLVQHLGG
jgi:lysophospholipase L1-like esterase